MVAAELVDAGNVNDRVPSATENGVLDDKLAATGLALRTDGVVALCGQARVMTHLHQRQDRLVDILTCYPCASRRCGVDVIAVCVDDVLIARADERRRRPVALIS